MQYHTSSGMVTFQRRDGEYRAILLDHGHFISLPKGMIEADENKKETAIRELKEETGLSLQASSKDVIHTINYKFRGSEGELIEKTVYFYAGVAVPDQSVQLSWEHEDIHIVDLDVAEEKLTYDGDITAYKKAKLWLENEFDL